MIFQQQPFGIQNPVGKESRYSPRGRHQVQALNLSACEASTFSAIACKTYTYMREVCDG